MIFATDLQGGGSPQPKHSGTGVPPVRFWFQQRWLFLKHTGGTPVPLSE